jgi:galactose mutarotase-like enzyme
MVVIEDGSVKASIHPKGAELQSLYNKSNKTEYMWSGDPAFWGKHSPVLFPIVGTLKNDTYYFNNKAYTLSRHGFARDKEFIISNQTPASATFTLLSDETTLAVFPFSFRFDIIYTVAVDTLQVTYSVTNTGNQDMYFSVGGHPAFKIPLTYENSYEDYMLEFNETEDASRWPISPEGLIEKTPVPFFSHTEQLSLNKELFYNDAIVLKQLKSNTVRLMSETTDPGLLFDFSGFPYLGIWAAKNADFVCIEPWCGIADSVDTNQQLTEKEAVIQLEAAKQFERSWSVKVF